MKGIFFLMLAVNCTTNSQAQNVGIGTTIPTSPLTVIANDTGKAIIQKLGNIEVGFYTASNLAFVQTWSPSDLNFATGNGSQKMTLQHSSGLVELPAVRIIQAPTQVI